MMSSGSRNACPVENDYRIRGYLAHHADMEHRHATGETQHFCGNCERWRWPDQRAACPFFEWKSVDPCPDAPLGTHHPECGPGFPKPGCHAECPSKLRSFAVLDGSFSPSVQA